MCPSLYRNTRKTTKQNTFQFAAASLLVSGKIYDDGGVCTMPPPATLLVCSVAAKCTAVSISSHNGIAHGFREKPACFDVRRHNESSVQRGSRDRRRSSLVTPAAFSHDALLFDRMLAACITHCDCLSQLALHYNVSRIMRHCSSSTHRRRLSSL